MKADLNIKFEEMFGVKAEEAYFSPGRVNIIGEHIDYNGGMVLPGAISQGTYGIVSKRDDMEFHVYSENFPNINIVKFLLDNIEHKKEDDWANYVKGVCKLIQDKGHKITTGLNIYVAGFIPNGSGLSSSASLEVLIVEILNQIFDFGIDATTRALYSQEVENKFMGVNCGIMDQFVISTGKKDNVIYLNTETLKYEYVPFEIQGHKLLILNTKKRRELVDSKYNERRLECESALGKIQTQKDIKNLCDLEVNELPEVKGLLTENENQRVEYVVEENDRCLQAIKFLENQEIEKFAEVLTGSHLGLKEKYEVTGIELDTIVELSLQSGAIGARMTGAGFGGCAIAVIKEDNVDFKNNVIQAYEEKIGYPCEIYEVEIGDGVKKI